MEDDIIRKSESDFLEKQIEVELNHFASGRVLDLGCGNGFTLKYLSQRFPGLTFLGIDINPKLISLAQNHRFDNLYFQQADICLFQAQGRFDLVFGQRSLINLKNKKEQDKALRLVADLLEVGGVYIMIESFKWPLWRLNQARAENDLRPIAPSVGRLFFAEGVTRYMKQLGLEEYQGVVSKHFLSTHFFNTRVIHPLIRAKGSKIKNSHLTNFLFEAIPPGIGQYSPILFRVFRKV